MSRTVSSKRCYHYYVKNKSTILSEHENVKKKDTHVALPHSIKNNRDSITGSCHKSCITWPYDRNCLTGTAETPGCLLGTKGTKGSTRAICAIRVLRKCIYFYGMFYTFGDLKCRICQQKNNQRFGFEASKNNLYTTF